MTTVDRFENSCFKSGCPNVALYGFDVDLLRGKRGTWACREHRDELEASRAEAQEEGPAPRQGSLL